jgi:hypothetical protein
VQEGPAQNPDDSTVNNGFIIPIPWAPFWFRRPLSRDLRVYRQHYYPHSTISFIDDVISSPWINMLTSCAHLHSFRTGFRPTHWRGPTRGTRTPKPRQRFLITLYHVLLRRGRVPVRIVQAIDRGMLAEQCRILQWFN